MLQVELTKEQIAILRQQVEQRKSVFKEKRFLESLSSPSFIIGRKREAKWLLEILLQGKDYLVPFVSIFGRSGSGKSSITRLVCESLLDAISFSYTDLRRARTIFNCANLILSDLDAEPVKSHEGINKALSLIEKRVEEILNTEQRKRFVLILDEFDVIFSDVRSDPSDFVYKLLNIVEKLRNKGYWLCIIAISNTNLLDRPLDERIHSRIGQSEIYFPPYKPWEIYFILKDRARFAFENPVKDEVLDYCARISGYQTGDCRAALDILRKAGELADGADITQKHVYDAYCQLNVDDGLLPLLKKITLEQRVLLYQIAHGILHRTNDFSLDEVDEEFSTNDIYLEYKYNLQDNKEDPLSYRRVFSLLANLEGIGLISGRLVSKGRHGRQRYYKLVLDYRIVGRQLNPERWDEVVVAKRQSDLEIQKWKEKMGLKTDFVTS